MTRIAKEFGLSKPTVSNMLGVLEEKGFAKRKTDGGIVLTRQGTDLVEELAEKHEAVKDFLVKELGIPKSHAERDALVYLSAMSKICVELTIQHVHMVRAMNLLRGCLPHTPQICFSDVLEDGVYQLPFTVFQKNSKKVSMGDCGFKKPAQLVVSQGQGVIALTAQKISYHNALGFPLKGRLERLNYWDGRTFVTAKKMQNQFHFPISHISFSAQEKGDWLIGSIRIQAAASVGLVNMPLSEADLELYFCRTRKIF